MTNNIIGNIAEKISDSKIQFIKEIEPFREELFNHCKSITATIWTTEDLAQDAILKTFAQIPEMQGDFGDTFTILKRVASNSCLKTNHKLHGKEITTAYANAFNNASIDEMSALLSENAIYEVKGIVKEFGINAIKAGSWMHASQMPMRSEVVLYNDENIILRYTINKEAVEKMSGILRITEQDSKIVHIEDYFFSPEVLSHVGGELKVDFQTNGHHWAV